ncbi:hypothetical protein TIFTF001_017718 [Ficus carica]|uniref:glutathione transferase n=1 Tax=Ficus carica TaxID=3494 RepID=A0AA88DA28_FICCA|nr:hypothetical protein TIFTF001_017718 [Ficus carica]
MGEEVKLLSIWSSPYALRIVWALKLKGVPYEIIYEDVSHKSKALIEYNPIHKKVPVLVHNGKPIAESLVILEYVDETWKQFPLLPQDPHQRAVARFWAKFGDEKVLPSMWEAFKKQGKEQEEALSRSVENLKFLEEELKGKKLFGGKEIGLVDIALGWLANLVFADSPVIKESWQPRDKMVTRFQAIREAYLSKEVRKDNYLQPVAASHLQVKACKLLPLSPYVNLKVSNPLATIPSGEPTRPPPTERILPNRRRPSPPVNPSMMPPTNPVTIYLIFHFTLNNRLPPPYFYPSPAGQFFSISSIFLVSGLLHLRRENAFVDAVFLFVGSRNRDGGKGDRRDLAVCSIIAISLQEMRFHDANSGLRFSATTSAWFYLRFARSISSGSYCND